MHMYIVIPCIHTMRIFNPSLVESTLPKAIAPYSEMRFSLPKSTKEYVRKCVPHVSTPMYICKTPALQTHRVCTYTYTRTYMHTHEMVQSSNPISITAEQFVCIWCVGGPWGLTRYQAPLVCCWSWVHRIKPERPHYSAHWRQGLACATFGLTTR